MAPTSAVSESCNFPPASSVLLKKKIKGFRVILESVAEKTVVPDGQPGERLLHELQCSSVTASIMDRLDIVDGPQTQMQKS